MPAPPADTLCYGECLDWMGRWDDATVDLIYLDPPFNSNANYNVALRPRQRRRRAGWPERPTAADIYDALRAEQPTEQQRGVPRRAETA